MSPVLEKGIPESLFDPDHIGILRPREKLLIILRSPLGGETGSLLDLVCGHHGSVAHAQMDFAGIASFPSARPSHWRETGLSMDQIPNLTPGIYHRSLPEHMRWICSEKHYKGGRPIVLADGHTLSAFPLLTVRAENVHFSGCSGPFKFSRLDINQSGSYRPAVHFTSYPSIAHDPVFPRLPCSSWAPHAARRDGRPRRACRLDKYWFTDDDLVCPRRGERARNILEIPRVYSSAQHHRMLFDIHRTG